MNETYGVEQIEFLNKKDMLNGNNTVEGRVEEFVKTIKPYDNDYYKGLSERIGQYILEGILSPSTPQWSNFGVYRDSGSSPLPTSCYVLSCPNSINGIYYTHGETAMMSKLGGGVGVNYSNVYDKGTYLEKDGFHTNSKLDWIEDTVSAGQKVSQGNTRRGYAVPFVSLYDAEFDDLMSRSSKKNPDKNDPLVTNNIGVNLPVGWTERMKSDNIIKKRYFKVLNERISSGKTYMVNIENMNKNTSPVYTKLNHNVDSTNICCEISCPSYDDKSFSCNICSINLKHWDVIKSDPQIIKDICAYLDISVTEVIDKLEGVEFMDKARKSAIEKRDIGLGTLGFHEYIQSKGFAFGDLQSRMINKEIYSTIQKYCLEYTEEIGSKLGSPKMCEEAGLVRRNVSLMCIAPNKSSSFIMGATSAGIEPFQSNYFVKELAGIQTTFRNPHLKEVLKSHGKDDGETWNLILENGGSVKSLDFLSEKEKSVFKTAYEISPKDMIDLVADRQVYVDMGQSFNLFHRPNYSLQDVYNIHKYAWERGVKTLYYYYNKHSALEEDGGSWDSCESCAD